MRKDIEDENAEAGDEVNVVNVVNGLIKSLLKCF
jgi:hypothetical protein